MGDMIRLLSSDSFIVVNRDLIGKIGLIEAIVLGELAREYAYWQKQGKLEGDFFYSTVENMQKCLNISKHKQSKAFNALQELGLVEIDYRGTPPRRYVKLNETQIAETLLCLKKDKS